MIHNVLIEIYEKITDAGEHAVERGVLIRCEHFAHLLFCDSKTAPVLRLGLNKELHDCIVNFHNKLFDAGDYAVEALVFVGYEHFVHLLVFVFKFILTVISYLVNGFGQTVISVTEMLRKAVANLK